MQRVFLSEKKFSKLDSLKNKMEIYIMYTHVVGYNLETSVIKKINVDIGICSDLLF